MRSLNAVIGLLVLTTIYAGFGKLTEAPKALADQAVTTAQGIVYAAQLKTYLSDKQVLRMLNADEVVIREASADCVVVADKVSGERLGEVYYTIQDGWHLKRDNERMEHRPGRGWLIWENQTDNSKQIKPN